MIKEIHLTNFQSHKDTILELHENLNVIIGSSNSGKSSIVRALKFILFGKWDPSFIKDGESISKVSIVLDNGYAIERVKGNKKNELNIIFNGTTKKYSGFGSTVPPEVIKIIGIVPLNLLDKEEFLNIAEQHDSIFLLTEGGSFRAKILSSISGLHILDMIIKDLNSEIRNISTEINRLKDEIDKFQKRIDDIKAKELFFNDIPLLKKRIDEQNEFRRNKDIFVNLKYKVDEYNSRVNARNNLSNELEKFNIEALEKELDKALLEIQVCPTCGNNIKEENLKFIKKS